MHHTKVLSLIFSLFFSFHASARVVTDTLQSSQKDQVIVAIVAKRPGDCHLQLEAKRRAYGIGIHQHQDQTRQPCQRKT